MFKSPLEISVCHWLKQGAQLLPPASAHEVEAAFAACGSPVSQDVLDLYERIGGFEHNNYCDLNWSLWSPAKIREYQQWNEGPRIWFADAHLDLQIYSLQYLTPEISAVFRENPENSDISWQIADSLSDFFHRLVTDPNSLDLDRLSLCAENQNHGEVASDLEIPLTRCPGAASVLRRGAILVGIRCSQDCIRGVRDRLRVS